MKPEFQSSFPAFAIGRTQTFMYYLRHWKTRRKFHRAGLCGQPMALNATDLYVKYKDDHDVDFARLGIERYARSAGRHCIHLTRSADDSKAINNVKTP